MSLPESPVPSRSKPCNSWAKAHQSSHWLLNVPLPLSQLISAVGYTAYNLQIGISPGCGSGVDWLYKRTAWADTLINYQRPLVSQETGELCKGCGCTTTQHLAQLPISHGKTTILSPTMFPSGFLQPRFCKIANRIIDYWPETISRHKQQRMESSTKWTDHDRLWSSMQQQEGLQAPCNVVAEQFHQSLGLRFNSRLEAIKNWMMGRPERPVSLYR